MALLTAGATLVTASGLGWYYWGGGDPQPINKKEIKRLKNNNKLSKRDLIKELLEVGQSVLKSTEERRKREALKKIKSFNREDLKPASQRKLKDRPCSESVLEKIMKDVRKKVELNVVI